MGERPLVHEYAKLSLISISIATMFIVWHHFYVMGIKTLIFIPLFLVLPVILLLWFRNTKSKIALTLYGLICAWIVIGFGFLEGFLVNTLKIIGYYLLIPLQSVHGGNLPLPDLSFNIFFDGTGMFMFIAAIFVAYFGFRFLQEAVRHAEQ